MVIFNSYVKLPQRDPEGIPASSQGQGPSCFQVSRLSPSARCPRSLNHVRRHRPPTPRQIRRPPLGQCARWVELHSYWKSPFIVNFPMKNGGSFHSYVTNYQRVHVDWPTDRSLKKKHENPACLDGCDHCWWQKETTRVHPGSPWTRLEDFYHP